MSEVCCQAGRCEVRLGDFYPLRARRGPGSSGLECCPQHAAQFAEQGSIAQVSHIEKVVPQCRGGQPDVLSHGGVVKLFVDHHRG